MNNDQSLKLEIETAQGDFTKEFPKTAKIQDVIDAVVAEFGFDQNGTYSLHIKGSPEVDLKPERPLVSFKLEDCVRLLFSDLGVAV